MVENDTRGRYYLLILKELKKEVERYWRHVTDNMQYEQPFDYKSKFYRIETEKAVRYEKKGEDLLGQLINFEKKKPNNIFYEDVINSIKNDPLGVEIKLDKGYMSIDLNINCLTLKQKDDYEKIKYEIINEYDRDKILAEFAFWVLKDIDKRLDQLKLNPNSDDVKRRIYKTTIKYRPIPRRFKMGFFR